MSLSVTFAGELRAILVTTRLTPAISRESPEFTILPIRFPTLREVLTADVGANAPRIEPTTSAVTLSGATSRATCAPPSAPNSEARTCAEVRTGLAALATAPPIGTTDCPTARPPALRYL